MKTIQLWMGAFRHKLVLCVQYSMLHPLSPYELAAGKRGNAHLQTSRPGETGGDAKYPG